MLATELEPHANAKTVNAASAGMTSSSGRRREAGKARARIVAVMAYPERIVPGETSPGILALHLARYVFAEDWCRDREVLDLGCGTGYGSFRLSSVAKGVLAVDVSEEAIAYAESHYGAPNLEFRVLDATRLPFDDGSFDVVTCFETIEHVDDAVILVGEAARVLRSGGAFIVSTPRVDRTTHSPDNPYHRIELSREDFEVLLTPSFELIEMYGEQRRQTSLHRLLQRLDVLGLRRRSRLVRRAAVLTGTPAMENAGLGDVTITRERASTARVLVAVCTR